MFRKSTFIITKVVLILIMSMIFMTVIAYDGNASTKKVQKAEKLMNAGNYYESFKMISKIKVGKKGYKEGQKLLVKLKEKAFSYYEEEINNKITEKEYLEGIKIASEALLIMPINEQIKNLMNNSQNLLLKSTISEAEKLSKEKKYDEAINKLEEIKYLYSDTEELDKKISANQLMVIGEVKKQVTSLMKQKKYDEDKEILIDISDKNYESANEYKNKKIKEVQFKIDNKEMGTVVTTKKFEATVLSYKVRKRIGNEYFGATPSKGAVFIIVRYKYKNISEEAIGLFSLPSLKLKDLKGNTYDHDGEATSAYAMEIDAKILDLDKLNPGITREEYDVFEIPLDRWKEKGWSAVVKTDKYIGYILK